MPKQPDTRTDIERRIAREQTAARLRGILRPILVRSVGPFGGTDRVLANKNLALRASTFEAARRRAMRELDESQESLTDADQQIANRIIDEELAQLMEGVERKQSVKMGRKLDALGLGHEEQTEHKKGGLKRKPPTRAPREFARGGAYRGKPHSYAAGGRVTDASLSAKRRKK